MAKFKEQISQQANHFDELSIKSELSLYSESPKYSQSEVNRIILENIAPKASASVLEVGAGKGQYTLLLLKHGYAVTANDVSKLALATLASEAQKYGLDKKLTILHGDITAIATNHGPYDCILFADTLHHLEFEQTIEILNALKSLLHSGGKLIAWEPNGRYPFWRQMHLINQDFVWEYEKNILHCTQRAFDNKFSRAGWTVTRYLHHRILPMPLLDRFALLRILDNFLMKVPFIRSRSAYSLISAIPLQSNSKNQKLQN